MNNTLVTKGTHELYLHLDSWLFSCWWNFISGLYWKHCHFVTHINSIQKIVFFGKVLRETKTKIKLLLFPSWDKFLTPSFLIFSSPKFSVQNFSTVSLYLFTFSAAVCNLLSCQCWMSHWVCWPSNFFNHFSCLHDPLKPFDTQTFS